MKEIDIIENKLLLIEPFIEFEEIIDNYLSETLQEDEIDEINKLEFRKDKLSQIQYRFKNLYGLNILTPENGFSILNVQDDEDINIKKYLHRFLSFKTITGGENANSDGSAELFECISANAVKNYLGQGSEVIMVGEGRVSLTSDRLNEISNMLNENEGVHVNLPKRAKDDGVDFIVYKPIDSRNIGNLIILGQACVGKHFNDKKVIHQRWQDEYIMFSIKPPTTLLSVVSFLESDELKRVHSEFGNSLVFDKARIMKYYNSTIDTSLNSRIITFVNNIT